MKILVLSDLHLEFANLPPPASNVEVVILAGDIWKKDHGMYWARATWPDKEVVYVAGNHEFYRGERNAVLRLLRNAAEETGVHFLDNDEIMIDGVRFLGATLWTDFNVFGVEQQAASMEVGKNGLNDFRLINEGGVPFAPSDAAALCNQSIDWLKTKLIQESNPVKTVVVTHHLPSMQSVADRYKNDILSACFAVIKNMAVAKRSPEAE